MTRTINDPVRNAIEKLLEHFLEDERWDYESCPESDRAGHVYEALRELDYWATYDSLAASDDCYGWPNYETCAVADWLADNDEVNQFWREVARECVRTAADVPSVRNGLLTARDAAEYRLTKQLRDAITGELTDGVTGLTAELVGASLRKVEWVKVAHIRIRDVLDSPANQPTTDGWAEGWANIETWAIAAALDDEGESEHVWEPAARQVALEAEQHPDVTSGTRTAREVARTTLAERLCRTVTGDLLRWNADQTSYILVSSGLNLVDWLELADSYLTPLDK